MGLGMMLIVSSWQTATLQSYFRARVKGVWVRVGRNSSISRIALSFVPKKTREVAQKLLFFSFVFRDLGQVIDAGELALVEPLLSLACNPVNQDRRHER